MTSSQKRYFYVWRRISVVPYVSVRCWPAYTTMLLLKPAAEHQSLPFEHPAYLIILCLTKHWNRSWPRMQLMKPLEAVHVSYPGSSPLVYHMPC